MKARRFDVVLMDIHMPGLDGYKAIRSMRDWETKTGNARTPIVVLSSDDLDTQMRSAAHSGCSGFLRKPLDHHRSAGPAGPAEGGPNAFRRDLHPAGAAEERIPTAEART